MGNPHCTISTEKPSSLRQAWIGEGNFGVGMVNVWWEFVEGS